MIDYKTLFNCSPFGLSKKNKDPWFFLNQKKLSLYHYKYSIDYRKISNTMFRPIRQSLRISELPYLHASIFKNFNLITKNNNKKISTFSSSGTSGKNRSKINIDPKTAFLQSKTLKIIFSEIINKKKDIFFVEKENFLETKDAMTAKGAAIKGFGQLCNKKKFLLDKKNNLKLNFLINYIKKNKKKEFIIFGFTSSVWLNLIQELKKKKIKLPKNHGIMIHGGGWKKMFKLMINNSQFKKESKNFLGLKNVYNYYGMIEQTGSIFLECDKGFFHCSNFSDIIVRNSNLQVCSNNQKGLIQTLSLLPLSYPGHNILTEDLGIIHGVDNCKCGKKGKYFKITGRVPDAELRGCSDVT